MDTLFTTIAGSTTPSDTGTVGRWVDRSMNSFNLVSSADDTTRPTWNLNSGVPYLNFDGSNDKLIASSLGMHAAGTVSIFAALRPNPGTSRDFISEDRSSSAAPFFRLTLSDSADANDLEATVRSDGSSLWVNLGNPQPTLGDEIYDNTDKVIGLVYSAPAANIRVFSNASEVISHAFTVGGGLTVDQFTLCGARVNGSASSFFACRLYALVIVKRVVTTEERLALTSYLGRKAGIVV